MWEAMASGQAGKASYFLLQDPTAVLTMTGLHNFLDLSAGMSAGMTGSVAQAC